MSLLKVFIGWHGIELAYSEIENNFAKLRSIAMREGHYCLKSYDFHGILAIRYFGFH